MPHDVFISYAHEDKPLADGLCATLEQNGIRCWIAPRDVLPGNWGAAIIGAIEISRAVVLVYSESSNRSPQVLREIERAVSKGLIIVPVRIQDVAPSREMQYYISSQHWIDALTPPIERHFEEIARKLKILLSSDAERLALPLSQTGLPRHSAARLPRWWIPALGGTVLLLFAVAAFILNRKRDTSERGQSGSNLLHQTSGSNAVGQASGSSAIGHVPGSGSSNRSEAPQPAAPLPTPGVDDLLRRARASADWSEKLRLYAIAARERGDLAAEDELFFFIMRANRMQRTGYQNDAFVDYAEQQGSWSAALWDSGESWFGRAKRAMSLPALGSFGVLSRGGDFTGGRRPINEYYDGPGAYAWEALQMASERGHEQAKEILSRGAIIHYLERSTNYLKSGHPKEALWAHVEALLQSKGKLPRTHFESLAGEIPALFKQASRLSTRELERLMGQMRDRLGDEGSLKEQVEEKIQRLETSPAPQNPSAETKHFLREYSEELLVQTYLVMSSLSTGGGRQEPEWPMITNALRLFRAAPD